MMSPLTASVSTHAIRPVVAMIPLAARGLFMAAIGAVAGVACVITAYTTWPALVLEMDQSQPRAVVSGFYPPERADELTFAWTGRRADVTLSGLDRRVSWSCVLRFRGGGPDLPARPTVHVAVDGITVVTQIVPIDFQELQIAAPRQPSRPGLSLTIMSSATFVPGPSDRRELGIQVDRLACQPDAAGLVLPPRRAIRDAGLAGAAFGAAFGLAGVTAGIAGGGLLLLAAGQAVLLSTGVAPYAGFPRTVVSFAVWIAGLTVSLLKLREAWAGPGFRGAMRFVLFFSAGALYLKVLGLLHPSKPLVDALFHAHRLEWVLAGRYYFTQPLPSGVSFPYAIGLYVFAAPWSFLTSDYVTLLRVIVIASDVVAGLLLWVMVVRTWRDGLPAAVAVVVFHVVPLPYGILGNANLTNLFGQSIALMTMAAATIWPLRARQAAQLIGLFLLASLAFLSHVSTFSLLFAALIAVAFFYRSLGGPDVRVTAYSILAVTTLAALFSVVAYYGHFREVYEAAVRARVSAVSPGSGAQSDGQRPGVTESARVAATPLPVRIRSIANDTMAAMGWAVLILAGAGIWRLWADGGRDRLVLALLAWGVMYFSFFALGLLAPVDPKLERYANEFVGRINLATYPAVAVLAARGAVWGWRAGALPAFASAGLLAVAVSEGFRHWLRWIT